MSKINFLFILVIAAVIQFGCTQSSEKKLISSSGKSSEVLVVTAAELWKGQVGDSVRMYLGQNQLGLNIDEPIFTLVSLPPEQFSDMFKTHRNILILEIDQKKTSATLEMKKDVWSQPQVVIQIKAPDIYQLINEFKLKHQTFIKLFMDMEYARIAKAYKQAEETKITTEIKKKFNFKLSFPAGYYVAKSEPNFMWVRLSANDYNQEAMIFTTSYRDTIQFSIKNILRLRDSISVNLPGPTKGSYMITDRLVPVDSRKYKFFGNYCIETRGLWKVANDFMGGVFVNYTFLDEANNRIVMLDGSVYYPNREKRDLLRQLEGIFHTYEPVQKQ